MADATATKGPVAPIEIEVTDRLIRFWAKNKLNVLLIGRHGIGKSQMVMEEWANIYGVEGKDWKYLSAPTLDPWVDFVGIPTGGDGGSAATPELILKIMSLQAQIAEGDLTKDEAMEMLRKSEDGDDTIKFIRPAWLKTCRAIFIDELNRSHSKVRNALMEAIQFRSINGMKLGELETVWGAINPTEDEDFHYDTDQLDAATRDRFPVQIYVKSEPSHAYFSKVFGPEVASAAKAWWMHLKNNLPAAVLHVSPRRLEMLIKYIQLGGEGRHIIPDAISNGADVAKLVAEIRSKSPLRQELKRIHKSKDSVAAAAFIADEKHYDACIEEVIAHSEMLHFWLPCMPPEKIATLFSEKSTVKNYVIANAKRHQIFRDVLMDIHKTTSDSNLRSQISLSLGMEDFNGEIKTETNPHATIEPGNPTSTEDNLAAMLTAVEAKAVNNGLKDTWTRQKAFQDIRTKVPKTPLSEAITLRLMNLLEAHLIGRAQPNALLRNDQAGQRMHGALATVNRLIADLSAYGYDFSNFHTSYASLWKYCLLRRDNFYFLMQ